MKAHCVNSEHVNINTAIILKNIVNIFFKSFSIDNYGRYRSQLTTKKFPRKILGHFCTKRVQSSGNGLHRHFVAYN